MTTPIKLNDDIIKNIQKKYIILIVGDMGCGKTTEASEIANIINKPTKVIIPHHHSVDEEMFDDLGFEKVVVDLGSKDRKSLKPSLKGVKDYVIIYDDYQAVSPRHKKTIKDLSIDLRKRKLQLILIYHGEDIPKSFLKDGNTILIVKRNSGFNRYKFSQFFKVKGVSTSAVDFCNDIKNHNSVYLLKNGKYYHRDGITNKITEGKLKSKVVVDVDEKLITDTLLASGLSQREVAEDYGLSASTLYKMVKNRKQNDKEFEKMYQNVKKEKMISKKGKIAKIMKSGVSLHIEKEKLYSLGNKNMRQIAQINNLKDIGNFAVEVVGESIHKTFVDAVGNNLVKWVDILIRLGKGGVDITIEMENKVIEIEVKNHKKTSKKKHITISTINRDVIPRFSDLATEKWLFTCGLGCNRKSKEKLEAENINYMRLSYKQLIKGDTDRKYHIKKKMGDFVNEII